MNDVFNQSALTNVAKEFDYHIDVIRVSNLQQFLLPNVTESSMTSAEMPVTTESVRLPTSEHRLGADDVMCNTMTSPDVMCDKKTADARLVESLSQEVKALRMELGTSRLTITTMHEREKELRNRLSEQAQRHLETRTTKFEDITLGENRPTQLIKRYGNLYTEGRVEALDALDDLEEMNDCDDLKTKLLLSVIVLAFRSAQNSLCEIQVNVREILHIPHVLESTNRQHSLAATELEETIAVYLKKTVDRHDLSHNYNEVCERVWATLFDYPILRDCTGLLRYIEESVRLAWGLTLQNPPLVIDYESKVFNADLHTRFHTSNADSDQVRTVLWPMLTEGENGPCVHRGVVVT